MPALRSHYDILNVSHDAEAVVIDAAYRALMKRYHPDQGPAPGEGVPSAARINEAFSVLRDPERRAEYDHKEWVRSQNIQLAQYPPPPPPRQSNFFGWGGWLVALLLAAAIALIAGRSGGVPAVSNGAEARAAASREPEIRSQPRIPKDEALSPAEEAEIRADAWQAAPPPPTQTAPTQTAPAQTAPAAAPAPAKSIAPAPSQASAVPPADLYPPAPPPVARRGPAWRAHMRFAARHRAVRADARAGKDFLERQGGIY